MSPVHDPRFSAARFDAARDTEVAIGSEIARWEYIKPVLLLAVGLIGWLGATVLTVAAEEGGGVAALVVSVSLFGLGIAVVIGLIALIITCSVLGTEGGPVMLVLVRLAGIYAIVFAVSGLLQGTFLLGLFATGMVMVGLIAWLFEMDVFEAFVVAIVSWLIWIIAWVTLLATVAGLL